MKVPSLPTVRELRATGPSKGLVALRLVASLPLLLLGAMHASGAAPMEPILVASGIPFAKLNAVVAPLIQIGAGALLFTGFFARVGALLAVATMVGALYSHVVADWTDEPTPLIAVAVLLASIVVLVKGAGGLSLDRRAIESSASDLSAGQE